MALRPQRWQGGGITTLQPHGLHAQQWAPAPNQPINTSRGESLQACGAPGRVPPQRRVQRNGQSRPALHVKLARGQKQEVALPWRQGAAPRILGELRHHSRSRAGGNLSPNLPMLRLPHALNHNTRLLCCSGEPLGHPIPHHHVGLGLLEKQRVQGHLPCICAYGREDLFCPSLRRRLASSFCSSADLPAAARN